MPDLTTAIIQKIPYIQSELHLLRIINHSIATLIGLPLSGLLFYLIIKRSPENIRSYTKILAMSAIVDTYLIVSSFLLQASMTTSNEMTRITFNGPLASLLGYTAYCPFIFFQNIGPQISVAILPVQFGYRYFTVLRNRAPTLIQTFVCFCLISSLSSIPLYLSIGWFCPSDTSLNLFDYNRMSVKEISRMIYAGSDQGGPLKQFSSSLTITIFYLIAIYFAYMTMKELNGRFLCFSRSENVKSVQAQLNKMLVIQSIIPLCTLIIPRFAFMGATYFGFTSKYNADILTLINVWFPTLNLSSTIFFIMPYRRYCTRLFKCTNKRTTIQNYPSVNEFQISVYPNQNSPISPILIKVI